MQNASNIVHKEFFQSIQQFNPPSPLLHHFLEQIKPFNLSLKCIEFINCGYKTDNSFPLFYCFTIYQYKKINQIEAVFGLIVSYNVCLEKGQNEMLCIEGKIDNVNSVKISWSEPFFRHTLYRTINPKAVRFG